MKDKFLLRFLISLIGTAFLGAGIGTFLAAGNGIDAGSVLFSGVSLITHTNFGTGSLIVQGLIIIAILFIDKSYIHVSTLVVFLLVGYIAQFVQALMTGIFGVEHGILASVFLSVLGLIFMGFGVAFYISAELGVSAIDLVAEMISNKFKFPYGIVRISTDVIMIVLGIILGGEFGVGTIFIALTLGPTISFMRKPAYALRDSILNKKQ